VVFVDAIPLTAVGKVYKPALRLDATRRAVGAMLAELTPAGGSIAIEVGADAVHGHVITVRIGAAAPAARAALADRVHARLDPLVMRHEIVWA
jgi:fatty-acyl-CoA synthase